MNIKDFAESIKDDVGDCYTNNGHCIRVVAKDSVWLYRSDNTSVMAYYHGYSDLTTQDIEFYKNFKWNKVIEAENEKI
ncbi:MAG: hypothetical protein WC373_16860 [Smithella sp.]|jgi:hypothetical protein